MRDVQRLALVLVESNHQFYFGIILQGLFGMEPHAARFAYSYGDGVSFTILRVRLGMVGFSLVGLNAVACYVPNPYVPIHPKYINSRLPGNGGTTRAGNRRLPAR